MSRPTPPSRQNRTAATGNATPSPNEPGWGHHAAYAAAAVATCALSLGEPGIPVLLALILSVIATTIAGGLHYRQAMLRLPPGRRSTAYQLLSGLLFGFAILAVMAAAPILIPALR